MTSAVKGERATELKWFRQVQTLAYECAEAVAAQLKPGMTEREAARMQRRRLRERGVQDWFHLPFAWFGDRTAFVKFRIPLQFFPTDRRLMEDLEAQRELILREVRERRPLRQIYEDVDRLMVRQGYANRHRAYPLGVIAHKVARVKERRWSPYVFGFGTQSLKGRAADALHGHRDGWSPLWSPYRFSDHPARPGWAVELHLAFQGTAVKFEEILVVTDSEDTEESAFWLDDDLPHVWRWAEEKCR